MHDLIKEKIAHEKTKQHMYMCQSQTLQLLQEQSQAVLANLTAELEAENEPLPSIS